MKYFYRSSETGYTRTVLGTYDLLLVSTLWIAFPSTSNSLENLSFLGVYDSSIVLLLLLLF